jgi:hypothetical protein
MIEFYEGPMVIVIVGVIEYRLYQRLLCHCSTFFNGAFNSNFVESETRKLTLDCPTESFELAIQWMYTGGAVLPPTVVSDSDKVSRLLDFLKLADFLHLTGPFTSIDEAIHEIVKDRSNLQSKHINEAMKLPAGTPARQIIVQACVGPYLESLGWSYVSNVLGSISDFRFKTELDELDGFAAELLRLFGETARKKQSGKHGQSMVPDPATGESMFYK